MISERKAIIEAVKETLNPFFRNHGLTHDEFKLVAKTSSAKVSGGGTKAEIQSVVYRTLLDIAPTTSLNSDGWNVLHKALGIESETDIALSMLGKDAAAGNSNDEYDASSRHHHHHHQRQMASGDEKITLSSVKQFLRVTREKQKREAQVAGQRRERD